MTDEQIEARILAISRNIKRADGDISFLMKYADAIKTQRGFVCDNHTYPYGVEIDGDHRPICVWCEALRADELERKIVDLNNQLRIAENLLLNATPNPKFLTMGYQEKWAKEFGKWWAKRTSEWKK